ncbi:MAG: DUF2631 domain-containing protein [Propionibacteriales bacterium]|nr:DUF2631 domain-containing protein [Propionibacteriales bacterium]
MKNRSAGIGWCGLGVRVAAAGGISLVLCLLAMLIGFELDVPLFVLLAVLIAVTVWFVFTIADPADEPHLARLRMDAADASGRLTDRRVLKLEEQLYGADPKRRMSVAEVQRVLAELVRQRLGRHQRTLTDELARPTVLSPGLARVIAANPAVPLSRTNLRSLIKEIAAL